jgi:hypothetical protein
MDYDRSHKGPGPRKFINSHKIDAENLDFCFLTIVFFLLFEVLFSFIGSYF